MNFIECCRRAKEHGLMLIRAKNDAQTDFDLRPYDGVEYEGWVYLDVWTAGTVCAVYDALGEQNRAHLASLPVLRVVDVCWKIANKYAA